MTKIEKIAYGSRLDEIISAFYMIVENVKISEDEVVQSIQDLIKDFDKLSPNDNINNYQYLLKTLNKTSVKYLQTNIKRILLKRCLMFKQVNQIEINKDDLLIFLQLLKDHGLCDLEKLNSK